MRMFPPNRRSGMKESAAQALKVSSHRAGQLHRAGFNLLRADPSPGQQKRQQREQKCGGAEQLEEDIGEVRSRIARQVQRTR